jgi:hypothetical protein
MIPSLTELTLVSCCIRQAFEDASVDRPEWMSTAAQIQASLPSLFHHNHLRADEHIQQDLEDGIAKGT